MNLEQFKTKGVKQFAIRTAIFFAILLGFNFFVFLYFRHTPFFLKYLQLPEMFYFDFISGLRKKDFINAALFTAIIFILWNRDTILKLKFHKRDMKQTWTFAILAVLSQVAHYYYKFWIRTNSDFALQHTLSLSVLKYVFNISFVVFLALSVYNTGLFKAQYKKFKKQLPFVALILVVYYFLIQFFQSIWRILGNFVAWAQYHMLELTFDNVYLRMSDEIAPRLGVGDFIVGISSACSGIDSLLLFISLYSVLLVMDWDRMDRKRMFLLLIPGLIGTVIYNLLRVYLLMLVGILYSPEFAIDMFHSNIGWILFLGFFILFWHFGSKYVYKK